MISAQDKNIKNKKSEAGFVAAEFLFSFTLVISCGLIVFALTFSLMTVEVAQYVTWSAARAYSAGNKSKAESEGAARKKFANLSAAFPLLSGAAGEWFELTSGPVGPNVGSGMSNLDSNNRMGDENRQPWSGMTSNIDLKLFKSIRIPFLGAITKDESLFSFPLHAFILRNPSQEECMQFYKDRYDEIKKFPDYKNMPTSSGQYIPHEDNGC